MEKKYFENMYENPPLVTSVINPKTEDAIETIKRAIEKGTDGFIFQLERMDSSEKTKENLCRLFEEAQGYPIMVTNYVYENNKEQTDEELVEFGLEALEAGASCLDVRGDTFDRGAKFEFTYDLEAVEKQKRIIKKVHDMGAQVIMSMHVWEFLTTEQVMEYAREMEARGVDIVKIVHMADTTDQLVESIVTTNTLHKEISVPVLHLLNGKCRELHRFYGTKFGSCLTFCVETFIEGSSESQPLLEKMKKIREISSYKYDKGGVEDAVS